MRINVCAEELTQETKVITKVVDGRTFYAVRLFLNDRSAITFWVPWRNGKNQHEGFITMMHALVDSAKEAQQLDK